MLETIEPAKQPTPRSASRDDAAPIILLEFNELSPTLLDRFMAEGKLPNFKRFHDASDVFVTQADVDTPVNLEPWIQWYSMHTGLAFEQHGVFHLTDGARAEHRDIWQIFRENGFAVGNWGSMNCRGFQQDGSFYLPDAWCATETPYPGDLNIVQKVISHYVQEYTNPDRKLSATDYFRFVAFLGTHGLSWRTFKSVVEQLTKEKTGGDIGWQRVPLLDQIYFDLFSHYVSTMKPRFSTFFLNSVAHYQHAYWRHMDPEPFTVKPGAEEQDKYGDAILYGYQCMDRLLGRIFSFEKQGYTLVLASALSQQPYLKYEHIGGHHFYRPHNIDDLLARLDVEFEKAMPVMTHQYSVRFADDEKAEQARRRLEALELDGQPVFSFDPAEPGSLYFGNTVHTVVDPDAQLSIRGTNTEANLKYDDIFYMISDTKSGRHHPDGILWFKNENQRVHPGKISILDVFPTLLEHFRIGLPSNKGHVFKGTSLNVSCDRPST